MNLALICKKYNIHYTNIGTGCIYKFDDNHPLGNDKTGFTEEEQPNFFGSSYSTVKSFLDQLMKHNENVLNLRIRMPTTDISEPRNYITKLTKYEYICSIPNSITVLNDFLPIIFDMMIQKHTGTFNMVNPGLISHNEILEMYRNIVNPDFQWKNFSEEHQKKY
jgi:hypothetical protein